MKLKSKGRCTYCKKECYQNTIKKHLVSCEGRKNCSELGVKNDKIYLIRASAGPFWVYFEVNGAATLERVDDFLRDLWLDCCGHLSAFTIAKERYNTPCELGENEKDMSYMLNSVLTPGLKFSHEYDFGTTTYLNLECIEVREGTLSKNKVNALARNEMPLFDCHSCKKPAIEICTQCIWDGNGLLCSACVKEHVKKNENCEEDYFLPVVNSPRMGMCGYTGDD